MDYLENQIAAMKKGSLVKPEVEFWINCENFVGDSGGNPAPMERFIQQLKMAAKYSSNIITFAYSHYYSPQCQFSEYHQQYLDYLKTLESNN